MDRETFEQLLSQWLDHSQDDELRAAVEAAAAESPELDHLKNEWVRLDRLVRGGPAAVDRIDWPRFRQRIARDSFRSRSGSTRACAVSRPSNTASTGRACGSAYRRRWTGRITGHV